MERKDEATVASVATVMVFVDGCNFECSEGIVSVASEVVLVASKLKLTRSFLLYDVICEYCCVFMIELGSVQWRRERAYEL